jgi:hypothetical protein
MLLFHTLTLEATDLLECGIVLKYILNAVSLSIELKINNPAPLFRSALRGTFVKHLSYSHYPVKDFLLYHFALTSLSR